MIYDAVAILTSESWFSNPAIVRGLWPALLETIYMVGLSSLLTVLLGLPLGLVLAETRRGGMIAAPTANKITGALVNLGRAIPFIILAIIVLFLIRAINMPFLKATGWPAFTIALAVSAIPYFARMVESNVLAVSPGKVEAAQMTGASRTRIMWDVLVREALPSIINSVTILVITIVGYSAMAGAVGGGGLGALAINQGYQRYQFDVIVIVVALILLMVQVIQWVGDMLSRMVDHR
ncbi:ABC transporter permease subunit [Trueperella pyogenes]|uniref:ABC transporter permease subunit n=1 Tax=Trueperella pyogenes TaxID=1661 RepID=A0A2S1KZH1_9ACTO|nr:ABC transporter permease subunit [Trueperella pyogenes]ALD74102.1 metal ABC transporter permease [Trueperella pyogenes]AWA43065.1 metal ABC transporter permease [Trueperella pyogenes]AWG04483.1 metal ABC transporter permease [Trueperella pyogenes]AWG17211.1 metal ABC transporter permease [Trueperella pyogenes]AZR01842.1 ABC transporter permease subunit [Trueperella pyogenes]